MHSCITSRPTLGPSLNGKLNFTCIICTHALTVQLSDQKRVLDFISPSLRTHCSATMAAAIAIDARHCR